MEALKSAYGDDVDILILVSRTHYNRTLTTIRASSGAAESFLNSKVRNDKGVEVTMEDALSQSWSELTEAHYATNGGRQNTRR